ncbi:hypothetical protein LPB136_03340 [Tenacibaculum todarodis]|uniref:PsbP C-terminal domain-containing protein n=1 Tax=Tenacibaculum todarodis TaxID=1850252 RepID=A0A1L3JHB0_9FLAO|nr:hypothetical protein [Tenacibaculum todarodis]APG64453.1 hypothetical protein LPB136_03340 [Tenacibaculum todarodis]
MKNKLLIIVLFLNVTVLMSQEWEKYKNEELNLVAYFPETPKKSIQKVETAVGTLDMHMIMHSPTSGDDNAVYSLIRSDYPKEQFESATSVTNSKVLDGAVNGAVNNVKGKLVFDNKINFNGYPGRNIKILIDGGFIYIKAILVENSMYIVQVICLTANDENKSINRFMDSFDIIKTKQ